MLLLYTKAAINPRYKISLKKYFNYVINLRHEMTAGKQSMNGGKRIIRWKFT